MWIVYLFVYLRIFVKSYLTFIFSFHSQTATYIHVVTYGREKPYPQTQPQPQQPGASTGRRNLTSRASRGQSVLFSSDIRTVQVHKETVSFSACLNKRMTLTD